VEFLNFGVSLKFIVRLKFWQNARSGVLKLTVNCLNVSVIELIGLLMHYVDY